MKKLLTLTLMSFVLAQTSFASCLEVYNQEEIQEIMDRRSDAKSNAVLAARIAALVAVPAGAAVATFATVGIAGGAMITVITSTLAGGLTIGLSDAGYFDPEAYSSLEKAGAVVNWAHNSSEFYGVRTEFALSFLKKIIAERSKRLMEGPLNDLKETLKNSPRAWRKQKIETWLKNNGPQYVSSAIAQIKKEIKEASESGELCREEIPVDFKEIKRLLK